MKYEWKMKEAINKEEAINSIADVMKQNPLWLNKITDSLSRFIIALGYTKRRKTLLNTLPEEKVIDIFVNLKTEYYNSKDNTQWI